MTGALVGRADNCGVSAVAVGLGRRPVLRQGCCARWVQRLVARKCLVRLWIHVLHHPGWLLEEFMVFHVTGFFAPEVDSPSWPARRRQKQWHAFSTGFAGSDAPRAVFPTIAGRSVRCFSCSRVALGNLFIFSTSLLYFQHVDFLWPSSAHNCECSRAGVPESPRVYSQVTRYWDCAN